MVLTQQEEFLKALFHRDFAKLHVHTVVETCCKCKCYQVITFRANIWSFGPDGRQAAKLSEVPSLLQQSRMAMATFRFADFFPGFGWVCAILQELMELKKNGGCSIEIDDTNMENRVSFSGHLVTSKDWV